MNKIANKMAADYYLQVQILPYNALLYHIEKLYMELINFRLFNELIIPLFERETFDEHLIILTFRSLANELLKRYASSCF